MSAELAFYPAAGAKRFSSSMVSSVTGRLIGTVQSGSALRTLPSAFNLSLDDTWAILSGNAPASTEGALWAWLFKHGIFDEGLLFVQM